MNKMRSLGFLGLTLSFLLMLLVPSALGQCGVNADFGVNVTSADDLTYTGFRNIPANPPGIQNITFACLSQFPALAGQGIAGALLNFGPNSINTIHNHPRGSEFLFVLSGSITAGLVDTTNRLFTKTLQTGDAFLFPMGLLHWQSNYNPEPATAFAAFSSPIAGRTSVAPAIFNSNPHIDAGFLASALALDEQTIERLFTVTFPVESAPFT